MADQSRGNIAFFATYRPPVPLDIYSSPLATPKSKQDEVCMTDGVSYNYDGQAIPSDSLKTILKHTKLASEGDSADVDSGRLSGMVFVSERDDLELLYIALYFKNKPKPKVFSLADVFGSNKFNGIRMEDSACFAGDYLIYISTKEDPGVRRQAWTAVYRTNLKNGETVRLTPPGKADLSPSVSPSGKKVAVASFTKVDSNGTVGTWTGEIENLETDIYVMDVEDHSKRDLVVEKGGWPTWGSDNIIFFHRGLEIENKNGLKKWDWGVYQADISNGLATNSSRVTPPEIYKAMTPAAIDANTVAVVTIRKDLKFDFEDGERKEEHYRHIEVFDAVKKQLLQKLTQTTRAKADHYNPFVIIEGKTKRIGYHRCNSDFLKNEDKVERKFHKLQSPLPNVGVFRVSGVFPTISPDGSKLAFVDNEFKAVWLADKNGLKKVFEMEANKMFSPIWSQNEKEDTLYICRGPAFSAKDSLTICVLRNVSNFKGHPTQLTRGFNNAFPSTNKDGTRLVFRSTRDGSKNLYIMENTQKGEFNGGKITRLTTGNCTDTHCQWSPVGNWIAFSSTRDKPSKGVDPLDNGLDPGFFAVYIVNANAPLSPPIRVLGSGYNLSGHVNHPCFSPDGKSIVVTSDLAAVSADPISLPIIDHSVRPYGDIFSVDIDPNDINKNKDVKKFKRITHSRYENSTPTWTKSKTGDPNAAWSLQFNGEYTPSCPYAYADGGEGWHMIGHLCLTKRCC